MALGIFFSIMQCETLPAQPKISTLDECLKIALDKNFSLQIVKNENEIAKNNYTKANAGLLPSVDATAGYAGGLNNSASENFSGEKNSTDLRLDNAASAAINANWDIFSGFKAQSKYVQLKELKEIGDLNTKLKIESLIADIASEYYQLILHEKHKNNLLSTLLISGELLRIAYANDELGSGSKLEFLQARVDFNSDSSNLVRQKQQILTTKIRLKTLMGEVDNLDIDADTLIRLLPELKYEALLEQTVNENTQLLIAAKMIDVSEQEIKIMRANTLPYLKLNSGYHLNYNHYSAGATKNSYNTGLDYGITLGFNIFDGGNRRREIKNAELKRRNSELARDEARLDAEARFKEIYSSYINNLSLILVENQNLKTAMQNFEIAMERYRLGELAGIDMRKAQSSLLDAEKRLLDVEYNAKIDEISLMMLSGNITEYLQN